MSEWISIEEWLPEFDQSVLVIDGFGMFRVAGLCDDGTWAEDQEMMVVYPTHWMPLPPPPNND